MSGSLAVLPDRPLDVDPSAFAAASTVLGRQVADRLAGALQGLGLGLGGTAAMGGSDPGGVAWARAYDEAVRVAAAGVADLTNACHSVAALLARSGFNHAAADAASAGRPPPPDTTDYAAAPVVTPPAPPSASGGSVGPPHGWGLIQDLVGQVWPDGDPATLRVAAGAWSSAADGVRGASALVPGAVSAIRGVRSPEIDDATAVCRALGGHLDEVAAACTDLAAACRDYADHVDRCHHDIEDELVSLLAWTAAIEAAGVVAGVFTAGIGEAGAQGVEAGRLAATAARIGAFLSRLAAAAGTVTAAVGRVTTRIAAVAQRLKPILGARLARATAEEAEKLPAVAEDAGSMAAERLETGIPPSRNFIGYTDKAAARQAFGGELRLAANRFFRDATAKSEQFQTSDLEGGGHRLQFFSPANNPGYGKLYVQDIDGAGLRIRECKDTLGPEGLIERKWVYGGP